MEDIQKNPSEYEIPIERVGITNFKMPIFITQRKGGYQHTVADINAFVDLKTTKGINMSRIPVGLQKFSGYALNVNIIDDIAEYIRMKSEAEQCQLIYSFPYFMTKTAPVSKEPSITYNNVTFDLRKPNQDENIFWMTVETNVTSLCPCSKGISENSAHNQRSSIKIQVNPYPNDFIWIEQLVEIAEKNASCDIYGVLKRPDEKYVTEKAYENPKFVEDMIRECYVDLINLDGLKDFRIEIHNYESIHQHNATAIIDSRYV